MRKIQNEFEIIIRHQTSTAKDEINPPTPVEHLSELTNPSVERRLSMGTSLLVGQSSDSTSACKSKSTSLHSLHQATPIPSEVLPSTALPEELTEPDDKAVASVSHVCRQEYCTALPHRILSLAMTIPSMHLHRCRIQKLCQHRAISLSMERRITRASLDEIPMILTTAIVSRNTFNPPKAGRAV